MTLTTLQDALLAEIKDLYSAEQQLVEALPKMAEKATSAKLKAGFETHLTETQGNVKRLEQVFKALGKNPKPKPVKP